MAPRSDKSVKVAVIGALAVIIAAAIPVFNWEHKPLDFIGSVERLPEHSGIANAKIEVTPDTEPTKVLFADSDGHFDTHLPRDTSSVRLVVLAEGYDTVWKTVNRDEFQNVVVALATRASVQVSDPSQIKTGKKTGDIHNTNGIVVNGDNNKVGAIK